MPDLSKVGVDVVQTQVEPYEEAKIRILNGGHTALSYLGALAGHQTRLIRQWPTPELRASILTAYEKDEVLVWIGRTSFRFDTSAHYLSQMVVQRDLRTPASQISLSGFAWMGFLRWRSISVPRCGPV